MPYIQRWYIPGKLFFVRYYGDVTIEDIRESSLKAVEAIQNIDRPLVHCIADSRDMETYGKNLRELNAAISPLFGHPRLGWIIYITDENKILRFLAEMVAQLSKTRLRMFNNEADALAFIQEMDTDLPSDLPSIADVIANGKPLSEPLDM